MYMIQTKKLHGIIREMTQASVLYYRRWLCQGPEVYLGGRRQVPGAECLLPRAASAGPRL